MHHAGLVSISFREQSPEVIVPAAAGVGLTAIEWGSDVHAPCDDTQRLAQIAALQRQYGISCCSYGTYFRLGFSSPEELPRYIRAAKILGTNILRIWAGRKKASEYTEAERLDFLRLCRQAAAIAEKEDVILCLECHRRSYTETREGALELMHHVDSPHFRMYWQPNPELSLSDNLTYLSDLEPYITHIHVFHWVQDRRLPLQEGLSSWRAYLRALSGSHHLLLEFMPDDDLASLPAEAKSLLTLISPQ